ncbi:MAG: UPF0058 family protein [Methanomicrobiales archaeon]
MQKEELLHLHMLMVHLKKYSEMMTGMDIPTDKYNSMHISPVHIHKNKVTHKRAILTLTDEMVSHMRTHRNIMLSCSPKTKFKEIAAEH